MKIKKVSLNNIAVFEEFNIELAKGINVIIGSNGSGKTIFLKMLYHTCMEREGKVLDKKYVRKYESSNSHIPVFLVRYEDSRKREETCWKQENGAKLMDVHLENDMIYIPVMEMLSHSEGLVPLYLKYKLPFEKTQIDIVMNAQLPETRETTQLEKDLLKKLEDVIGGSVVYKEDKFYIQHNDGIEVEFEMEAEGLRKFALLWKLIRNGLLKSGSVLLWDEPEANINPELLPVLVDILLELEKNGVQIVLTTHSYNLAKYFEIKQTEEHDVMFHSFFRGKNKVEVFSHRVFGKIKVNKLIEADEELLDIVFEKGLEE